MKKLNLGCGHKKLDGYINIDINPDVKADVTSDAYTYLKKADNESIDEIFSNAFIEHISVDVIDFFKECHRVLKYGGILHIITSNPFFWKNRIRFLFNRFYESGEWHPYKVYLISP